MDHDQGVDVTQRQHWLCRSRRPCAQSWRQYKNAPIESWDLMWNWYSLTDCTQNNLSRSPAQLCQTTSRTTALWNQSRCSSESQAAAVRGSLQFDFIWFRDEKCLLSNRHSTRRRIGFMHQLITSSDTSIPAVCYACGYGVCYRVTSGIYRIAELIFVNPMVKVNGQYYCDVLLSQQMLPSIKQSNVSQNVVYSQNNMLLTAKLVTFCVLWFPKVR